MEHCLPRAVIARFITRLAAFSLEGVDVFGFIRRKTCIDECLQWCFYFDFAVRANLADQTLGAYQMNRCSNQKWFDSHIKHARNRGRCVICMYAGEDKVSGQCSLDRNFRRFKISNFSDQDYIGVLP